MRHRVVLVGGGLAHLHLLQAWRRRAIPDTDLVIVSPEPQPWYSGMVPGYLYGAHEEGSLEIALAHLAGCLGARLVTGMADRVLRGDRLVVVGGERIAFDACSIDVGSAASGADVPGRRGRAMSLRPMSHARAIRERLDALAGSGPVRVVVVGAGAGGVEVAFALRRRLADAGNAGSVSLVDGAPSVLPGEADSMRQRVLRLLRERGIGVVLGSAVAEVAADAVRLASGADLPADLVVWTTGGAPPALLAASDLPRDDAGYLLVDRTLMATGGTGVWGAGDCITIAGGPAVPRSGVYALRQGGTLLHNLRATLGTGRVRPYRPRHRALAIIDTADGAAVARWGTHHGHGAWAWRLKRGIDLRFVNRFREPCDESRGAAS